MKAKLDSRFPNLPKRLTTDEIVRRAARRKAEKGRMKTQNPTTAATQFKAELWTTVSGPGGTREVWATIMVNGPDKGWPCAFGPKDKMEEYAVN